MAKLAPSLAEWRMHSIEQHTDHSSDEEFFDASGMCVSHLMLCRLPT